MTRSIATILAVFVTSVALASGSDGASWWIDVSTSGEDIYWQSPGSVRVDGETYVSTFTIQSVSVNVSYLGIEFGPFDVTGEIDSADLVQSGEGEGPCPVNFGTASIIEPPPPDPVTFAFDITMELNADGNAICRVENIVLGTATYDLGWPFGEVTVQLEEVFFSGDLEVEVFGSYCAADLDGNGSVGVDDLLAVIADWGCSDCSADIDGDGSVGVNDLLAIISGWGICP